jgi:hypothetical protein
MNRQQFEGQEPQRAQRMTEEEAQAVIALWQQKQKERERMQTLPSVPDVAEGLGIPVEEADALLREVRVRREQDPLAAEQTRQTAVQSRSNRRSPLVIGVIAVLVLLLLSLITWMSMPHLVPAPPDASVEMPAPPTPAPPPEPPPAPGR